MPGRLSEGAPEFMGQPRLGPRLVQRRCCMLLCRRSVVVLQQTTQSFTTGDLVADCRLIATWEDQHVTQSLVISFFVVMCHDSRTARQSEASPTRITRSRHDSLMVR